MSCGAGPGWWPSGPVASRVLGVGAWLGGGPPSPLAAAIDAFVIAFTIPDALRVLLGEGRSRTPSPVH